MPSRPGTSQLGQFGGPSRSLTPASPTTIGPHAEHLARPRRDSGGRRRPTASTTTATVTSTTGRAGLRRDRQRHSFWSNRRRSPTTRTATARTLPSIVGARGNDGYGVAGLNWNVKLMNVKIGNNGPTSAAVATSIRVRAEQGRGHVQAASGSTASRRRFRTPSPARRGRLHLRCGQRDADVEATPFYPCNYTAANIICAAATDEHDDLASFSNYGSTSVDLAAPGALSAAHCRRRRRCTARTSGPTSRAAGRAGAPTTPGNGRRTGQRGPLQPD